MTEQLLFLVAVMGILIFFVLYKLTMLFDQVARLKNDVSDLLRREAEREQVVRESASTLKPVYGIPPYQPPSILGITNLPRSRQEDV